MSKIISTGSILRQGISPPPPLSVDDIAEWPNAAVGAGATILPAKDNAAITVR